MGQSGKKRGRKRKAPDRRGKRSGYNSPEEPPLPSVRDESEKPEGSEGDSRHPEEEDENEGRRHQTFLHFFFISINISN